MKKQDKFRLEEVTFKKYSQEEEQRVLDWLLKKINEDETDAENKEKRVT